MRLDEFLVILEQSLSHNCDNCNLDIVMQELVDILVEHNVHFQFVEIWSDKMDDCCGRHHLAILGDKFAHCSALGLCSSCCCKHLVVSVH